VSDWREIKDSQVAQNQRDRIALNKTICESAIGRNLVEAAENLLADQAGFFDGVARFEILSARRISTSFRVQITGHEGELWEVWEFEIFTHSDSL
jgi:hypothetical protein